MMILNIKYFIAGIPSTVANNEKVWKIAAGSLSVGQDFESDISVGSYHPDLESMPKTSKFNVKNN